jgi:hypothetical protein
MALRRSFLGVSWRKVTKDKEAPVDDLDGVRDAVIGDGLLLVPGRKLRLYAVAGGRARHLGAFSSAASAWRCLDALDLATADAAGCEAGRVAGEGEG